MMHQKRNRVFGWTSSQVGMLACFLLMFTVLFSSVSANELKSAAPSSSTLERKKPLPTTKVRMPPASPQKPIAPAKPEAKPTAGVPAPPTTPSITAEDCSRVRKQYVAFNYPLDNVAGAPIPGTGLSICTAATYTCCTPKMERRLQEGVGQSVRQTFRSSLRKPAMHLEMREAQLLKFLHKMLNASYSQLNKMFTQTYGLHYNQNAQTFVDFYNRMHKYLEGKEDNVTEIVDALFKDMGRKMIRMLHFKDRAASTHRWRYPVNEILNCLVKNFHGAQAYGPGPGILTRNLIRSLTAGRTLAMALGVQRETLASVMKKLILEPECLNALTRINYCSLCSGLTGTRPCPNFCSNVIRGCFAQLYQFESKWEQLSNTALKLANLLEGRNNLVYIFESTIAVKLSESITNFQTNFQRGKSKIYSKCRSPYRFKRLAVSRRDVPNMPPPSGVQKRARRSTDDFMFLREEFKRLLSSVKSQVLIPQRKLWKSATDGLCRDGPFHAATDSRRCWNGTAVGPYEGALVADSLKGQVENPEVAVDVSRSPAAMSNLAWLLREAQQRTASAAIEREVTHLVFARTDLGRAPAPKPDRRTVFQSNAKTGSNLDLEGSGSRPGPGISKSDRLPSESFPDRASGSGDSALPGRPQPKQVTSTTKAPRPPIDDDDGEEPNNRKPLPDGTNVKAGAEKVEGSGVGSGEGPVRPDKPKTRPSPNPWPKKLPAKPQTQWPNRKLPETRPKVLPPPPGKKPKYTPRLPTPGDDEDGGSGQQPRYSWNDRRKGLVDGSGFGPGSGGQPLRPQPPNLKRVPGTNMNRWPEESPNSYPSGVWLPKKVHVANPDKPSYGDYTVQTESGPRRCSEKGCNSAVRSMTNNCLLLLTVAVLSASFFV